MDKPKIDPELDQLLDELLIEIRDLLRTHSSSEVVEIMAERRRYRRLYPECGDGRKS
jgi:hypothetical protein